MLFKLILSPIRSALLLIGLATALAVPARAQNLSRGDDLLLDMSQSFKRGDRKRLSALLPQARGHTLEPWAAYWELKARLDEASPLEVQDFLTRYAGTYQEDRLRNDWLLLLGQRRDWTTFAAEHPRYRMGDDREVRCYALLVDFLKNTETDPVALAAEVRKNWLGQRDADDGCALAADRLIDAKKLKPEDAWRKARLSIEANRPRAARRAVEIVAPESAGLMAELLNSPAKFLTGKTVASGSVRKELIALALVKMAMSDVDAAESQLNRWGHALAPEERNWVWGVLAKQAASRLTSEAVEKFGRVSRDADLSDDTLGWKVRANLRETGNNGGGNKGSTVAKVRWASVLSSINAMSDNARREPTWVYWKARALLALSPSLSPAVGAQRSEAVNVPRIEATALLESIASPNGFYEQLALEQLGQRITAPPRPAAPTPSERDVARNNPTLNRALYAIGMGLRSEGVREWNYGTNLVNSLGNGTGQGGPMSDRELLAAADYACERKVWDRCINTSERTKTEFDSAQRYPMPFRDAVVKRSGEIGLDAAYVYGLIRQESRFIMDARSGVGASGLMQVMPATANWTAKKIGMEGFTADQLNDRDTNIAIGTGYLKLVLDDFGGSLPLAAASYTAGPGRPRSWRNGPVMEAAIWAENVPFSETRDYVKKVLANTTLYAAILSGQPQSLKGRLGLIGPREGLALELSKDLP